MSRQTNPLQVPQKGPCKREPAHRAFAYLSKTSSFRFPGKGALPEAPSMEPLVLALVIRHTQRIFSVPHFIVVCVLSDSTIFLYIIS
jgi:hypothetical protein